MLRSHEAAAAVRVRHHIRLSKGDRVYQGVVYAFLLLFILFVSYPLLYVISCSFSSPEALVEGRVFFLPVEPGLQGYKAVFQNSQVWSGYLNSIIYSVSGTLISTIVTIIGGYVLSRKEFKLRPLITAIFTFTMFFNGGLVPTYLTVKNLGLIDNRLALILPVAISTWNLIILRTSIEALPQSLIESARIDGANDVVILFRIVLPLVKATIAVLVLYYAVGHWNSWVNAMLYIKDRSKYPLQLILREILIENTSNAATQSVGNLSELDQYKQLVKYCTTMIATAPILFIYPFLQKYFVKGVMIGAVKG